MEIIYSLSATTPTQYKLKNKISFLEPANIRLAMSLQTSMFLLEQNLPIFTSNKDIPQHLILMIKHNSQQPAELTDISDTFKPQTQYSHIEHASSNEEICWFLFDNQIPNIIKIGSSIESKSCWFSSIHTAAIFTYDAKNKVYKLYHDFFCYGELNN